jgi:hypothetical protein
MGVTASSPIAALALAQDEVAKNTSRTPISCDVDGVLERQKFSIADVKREGDWFLDEFPGIIIVHEDTVATLVAGSTVATFTYNYYAAPSAGTDVASAHRYAHFDGTCRPGDLVSCDKQSNFCVRNSGSDIFKNTITLGRVLYEISEPRGMLNKVKTAWNRAEMGATARMPGTATGGYTDAITLSSEVIADRQVVLTFNCL